MKLNKRKNLKDECKSTGKSPKKPRRSVKRFGEMSEEDVLKLKHSRTSRLQSGYSVYKLIDVSYMAVWSCR